jgi:hypothetical protein
MIDAKSRRGKYGKPDSKNVSSRIDELLGMQCPRGFCERGVNLYLAHRVEARKNMTFRTTCGCNCCPFCLPKKLYRNCYRAAECMMDAEANGNVLASTTIPATRKARKTDDKRRERAKSGGAVMIAYQCSDQVYVIAEFPKDARLPAGYELISLAEACEDLGDIARRIIPTEQPEKRGKGAPRGKEIIGLRDGWRFKPRKKSQWKLRRRLRWADMTAYMELLTWLGVADMKVRYKSGSWSVTWTWPPDFTDAEIAEAERKLDSLSAMRQAEKIHVKQKPVKIKVSPSPITSSENLTPGIDDSAPSSHVNSAEGETG